MVLRPCQAGRSPWGLERVLFWSRRLSFFLPTEWFVELLKRRLVCLFLLIAQGLLTSFSGWVCPLLAQISGLSMRKLMRLM